MIAAAARFLRDPRATSLLWMAFVATIASAQQPTKPPPRLEVAAQVGWGGFVKQGRWSPVFVTLINRGVHTRVRLDLEVPVGVETKSHYLKEVDLPSPARRTEILYFRAGAFSGEVTLRVTEPKPRASPAAGVPPPFQFESKYEPEVVSAQQPLVAELSESRAGQSATLKTDRNYGIGGIYGNTNSVQLVYLQPKFWPDRWYGYNCLDALIVSDYSARLVGAAELKIIEQWIKLGGRLVILGGETGAALKGTQLERLLRVRFTGRTVAIDSAKEPWLKQFKWTGWILLAEVQRDANRPDLIPLRSWLTEVAPLGKGTVIVLSFNDLHAPVVGSRGWSTALAQQLMSYSRWDSLRQMNDEGGPMWGGAVNAVADVPALALPSRKTVAGLLLLYVLMLGPLHWLIGRKTPRLIAGATFPLTIAVFTLVTYRHGRSIKGTHVLLNEVAVAQTESNAPYAQVQSLFGILSPDNTAYTLTATDRDTLISRPPPSWGEATLNNVLGGTPRTRGDIEGINMPNFNSAPSFYRFGNLQPGGRGAKPRDEVGATFTETDRLAVSDVRIRWGAMELFRSESIEPLDRGIVTHLHYDSRNSNRVHGIIENQTPLELEDAWISFGYRSPVYRVSRIHPGERVVVANIKDHITWQEFQRLQTQGRSAAMRAPRREPPRQALMRSLAPMFMGGNTLVAFTKNPPPTLTVRPGKVERRKTELLVVQLQVRYPEGFRQAQFLDR